MARWCETATARIGEKKDLCRAMRTKVGLFVQKTKDCFILADFIERRMVEPGLKTRKTSDSVRLFSDYQGASAVKKSVLRIAIVRGNLYFCTRARLVLASKPHFDAGGAYTSRSFQSNPTHHLHYHSSVK